MTEGSIWYPSLDWINTCNQTHLLKIRRFALHGWIRAGGLALRIRPLKTEKAAEPTFGFPRPALTRGFYCSLLCNSSRARSIWVRNEGSPTARAKSAAPEVRPASTSLFQCAPQIQRLSPIV